MAQHSLAEIVAGRSAYQKAVISPGGRHALVLTAIEAFNSQWVENATLLRVDGEVPLAQLGEWQWTVDETHWQGDDAVTLYMRRYPGDAPGLVLRLDIPAEIAMPPDTGTPIAFVDLTDWLEAWYAAHRGQR